MLLFAQLLITLCVLMESITQVRIISEDNVDKVIL